MFQSFATLSSIEPLTRSNEHGGVGAISFRRMMSAAQFQSPIDFLDFTVIPPGSTIGRHEHVGNEEVYFIASGAPLMRVNGKELRLEKGALTVVRSGEWHELINDTSQDVEIFVIQVRHA